jgi:sugar fermentation stimulation protein A
MKTLLTPEVPCTIHDSQNPKRKLRYTLTYLQVSKKYWALVDTQRPNAMVDEGVRLDLIPELSGYDTQKREVKYGSENSKIDLLLTHPDRPPCYVEVKNNTMISEQDPKLSIFPDAVTTRGAKHLRELAQVCQQGGRAVMFYLVNRGDAQRSGIAEHIDPSYAQHLREAMSAGVEVICYRSKLSMTSMQVGTACPFDFPSFDALSI